MADILSRLPFAKAQEVSTSAIEVETSLLGSTSLKANLADVVDITVLNTITASKKTNKTDYNQDSDTESETSDEESTFKEDINEDYFSDFGDTDVSPISDLADCLNLALAPDLAVSRHLAEVPDHARNLNGNIIHETEMVKLNIQPAILREGLEFNDFCCPHQR